MEISEVVARILFYLSCRGEEDVALHEIMGKNGY